ncbi:MULTISPECIES: hypothetical protein [unclassified Nocardia]|uniref:hypothetical protein n=1 Tax=unclassified Nocardia TaxID=2637762 RepID=UPI00278BC2E6|nr:MULTISPECIES: hypothetical protein [unclassified Nocardia]
MAEELITARARIAELEARVKPPMPTPTYHLDVPTLVRDGATLLVTYNPGEQGRCDEYGYVITEPHDGWYIATLTDVDGIELGWGDGTTVTQAIDTVRPRTYTPAEELDDPPF